MNHCAIQQNVFSGCEQYWSSVSVPICDRRDSVVCPKPRRLGQMNNILVRSLRWNLSFQAEHSDSNQGTDVLDFILNKDEQSCTQFDSSPPFFCGSPPSRVANPLIQDARFGDEELSPVSSIMPIPPSLDLSSSPSSSAGKGGCVRANFGNNPSVRIEGFDCLDRDHNCSIPTLA